MGDDQGRAIDRFEAIYTSHYAAVSAYTRRRTVDPVDAQDAVAEVFTIAWRRLAEMPDGEAVLPWLYGVARRVMANQRRGNRRRGDLSVRMQGPQPETPGVEAELISSEERRTVLAALARLRDNDQEILRLAVWEELSHREIAGIVECAEASVAVRLHRARTRLGREIEKEERRDGQEGGERTRRQAEGGREQ